MQVLEAGRSPATRSGGCGGRPGDQRPVAHVAPLWRLCQAFPFPDVESWASAMWDGFGAGGTAAAADPLVGRVFATLGPNTVVRAARLAGSRPAPPQLAKNAGPRHEPDSEGSVALPLPRPLKAAHFAACVMGRGGGGGGGGIEEGGARRDSGSDEAFCWSRLRSTLPRQPAACSVGRALGPSLAMRRRVAARLRRRALQRPTRAQLRVGRSWLQQRLCKRFL